MRYISRRKVAVFAMRDVRRIIRPRTFAALFGGYFAAVGVASWTFASGLSFAWYPPDLSRWVYSTYFVGSAVLLLGLTVIGYVVQSAFDRRAREVNERIQETRAQGSVVPPELQILASPSDVAGAEPDDIETTMTELVRLESDVAPEGEADMGETMVLLQSQRAEAVALSTQDRRLLRRRESLKLRQEFIVKFLAGPAVSASVILSVSGMLLPGADGFLQTYHQLNTALVLGFAYSWPGIGAYLVASILALLGSLRTERKKPAA